MNHAVGFPGVTRPPRAKEQRAEPATLHPEASLKPGRFSAESLLVPLIVSQLQIAVGINVHSGAGPVCELSLLKGLVLIQRGRGIGRIKGTAFRKPHRFSSVTKVAALCSTTTGPPSATRQGKYPVTWGKLGYLPLLIGGGVDGFLAFSSSCSSPKTAGSLGFKTRV